MKLQAKTQVQISKPVHEVFEAIVDPTKMEKYFITAGSARLEEGKTITWTWEHYKVSLPVHVQRMEVDKFISFKWPASGTETLVEFTLEPINETITELRVKEDGWDKTDGGIASLAEQTQGWVFMVTWLKAYLEYGIKLMTVVNSKFD
ncbi:MAG TPA: SRPBCC domain-containing protein [Ferruginibacter sp.]|nr:SRPBCC domain-containing protein [Ferruginibacter sp.]